jgi:hypothetical protein
VITVHDLPSFAVSAVTGPVLILGTGIENRGSKPSKLIR